MQVDKKTKLALPVPGREEIGPLPSNIRGFNGGPSHLPPTQRPNRYAARKSFTPSADRSTSPGAHGHAIGRTPIEPAGPLLFSQEEGG